MARNDSQPSDTLLLTKLHRPQVGREIMVRGRLDELLDHGLSTPMTLVSAPAGYGKSMAIRDWSTRTNLPFAWLSLDSKDSDPITFLKYVTAALLTMEQDAFTETWALVSAPTPPPISVIVRTLANEMAAIANPFILTLDDYHRIDSSSQVHEIVNNILDHPPVSLRLVIISRRDPPLRQSRLRAGGLMTEVRLQDLRFTDSETAAFLDRTAQIAADQEAWPIFSIRSRAGRWACAWYRFTCEASLIPGPS